MNNTTTTQVHKFETAGLGKAPYRYLGVTEHKFVAAPGCTAKPGASCDYCGASIMYAAQLESVDGKRFKVGCDCVLSMGDKGMRAKVASWQKAHDKALNAARKANKAAQVQAAHADLLSCCEALSAAPGFAGNFTSSVARQIKAGKAPSPKQVALIERLANEC